MTLVTFMQTTHPSAHNLSALARGCEGATGGADVAATGVATDEGDGKLGKLVAEVAHLVLGRMRKRIGWGYFRCENPALPAPPHPRARLDDGAGRL